MANYKIKLKIAGLPIRLNLKNISLDFMEKFNRRYSNFKYTAGDFKHTVSPNFTDRVTVAEDLIFKKKRNLFKIEGRGMNVFFSPLQTGGEILENIHILDSLLRIIYSRLLITQNGFLIHASAASGEIYTGPAGSGKTTSVQENKEMLGDDIVSIKKTKNQWKIFSTPFTGEFEGLVKNKTENLDRINILTTETDDISSGGIYKTLLKNIIYYIDVNGGLKKLTDYCQDIAGTVPARGYYKSARKLKNNRLATR